MKKKWLVLIPILLLAVAVGFWFWDALVWTGIVKGHLPLSDLAEIRRAVLGSRIRSIGEIIRFEVTTKHVGDIPGDIQGKMRLKLQAIQVESPSSVEVSLGPTPNEIWKINSVVKTTNGWESID